jgi:hypothetical protein
MNDQPNRPDRPSERCPQGESQRREGAAGGPSAMTHLAQEELREHMQRGTRMSIFVDLPHASAVAALLSLALKHPSIRSTPAAMAIGKTVVDAVIANLEQLGAANMAAMLRKGEEQPGFAAEPSANGARPASGAAGTSERREDACGGPSATTARSATLQAASEEIAALRNAGRKLAFQLDPGLLVAMLGAVQAAIRSPMIPTPAGVDAACRHGTELIAQACEAGGAPHLAASIRRGWDPAWDSAGLSFAGPSATAVPGANDAQPASAAPGDKTSECCPQGIESGVRAAPAGPSTIYKHKVLQASNLLIEAFTVHDQVCQLKDCREKGNALGFLAHCLGADAADLQAMRKALLEYDLACGRKA